MGAVKDEVYKCDVCGNVVKVLNGGDGDLVCCGEDMKLLTPAEAKAFA
jgi:superoxide reductase